VQGNETSATLLPLYLKNVGTENYGAAALFLFALHLSIPKFAERISRGFL